MLLLLLFGALQLLLTPGGQHHLEPSQLVEMLLFFYQRFLGAAERPHRATHEGEALQAKGIVLFRAGERVFDAADPRRNRIRFA